jgi:ATP-dependent Clp protease ATP-binding subunit ClpC
MSEYSERFNVSKLLGAPPGYVGSEDGGQLTEAVRRKKFSVILFDEIEKAHDQIFDILLQIMEEGKLTDAMGRVVDFKNTIVILTSNIGSHLIQNKAALGFKSSTTSNEEVMEGQINDELAKHFKPEFLNRLDDKVIFTQLNRDELHQILALELGKLQKLLKEKRIEVQLTEAAKDFLLEKGWNPEMGARPLRRAVSQYVEDLMADEILRNHDDKKFLIDVDLENNRLAILRNPPSLESI